MQTELLPLNKIVCYKADRYVRAGVSYRTAPAMIFPWGGSETGVVQKQSGTLWAMTTGPLKDTPALDALKASCGALIITYITQITAYFMEGGVAYDRS